MTDSRALSDQCERRRRPRRPRRSLARWCLGGIAAYGICASLVLLAIGVLRDGSPWTYVAALLVFWWLTPAPLLAVLALGLRSWTVVAAVTAPALTCVYVLGPYALHNLPGALPDDQAQLRVATYNLSNGRPLDGLPGLVAGHRPDILLLQEVTNTREELSDLLPAYSFISAGAGVSGPGHDGYAVASRYPIRSTVPVTGLPAGARPTDVVTVDVSGRSVAVISVHLASPCIGCQTSASNPAGDTQEAAGVRIAEARRYADLVDDLIDQGHAVILGGDLNASPLNQPLGQLTDSGLVDAQAAVGTGPGLTRGPGPGIARVDVVLVSGLKPVRVSNGDRGASDHAPVIADVNWPSS